MKSYEYDAVVWDGEVYCRGCLPIYVDHPVHHTDYSEADSIAPYPIFADSEWETVPTCCICGEQHDYVTILHGSYVDDGQYDFFIEREKPKKPNLFVLISVIVFVLFFLGLMVNTFYEYGYLDKSPLGAIVERIRGWIS